MFEAAAQGSEAKASKQAIQLIIDQGALASAKECKLIGTRCFVIKTEDAEHNKVNKWIFAVNHPNHLDLKVAFNTLRNNGCPVSIAASLEQGPPLQEAQ